METNIEFIKDLCRHPKFQAAEVHTGFIDENYDSLFPKLIPPSDLLPQAALALILSEEMATLKSSLKTNNLFNPFNTETGYRINNLLNRRFELLLHGEKLSIDVQYIKPEVYSMRTNDIGPWELVTGTLTRQANSLVLRSEIDGKIQKSRIVYDEGELYIFTNVSKPSHNIFSRVRVKMSKDQILEWLKSRILLRLKKS